MLKLREFAANRFLAGCTLFAFLIFGLLHAQTVDPDSSQPPSFHSKVRVVLLDVVVTDKDEPVSGLKKEDFQVFEDGVPQKISYFEEHKGIAPTQIKLPSLPSNVFTNYPVTKSQGAANVLLLDTLNTPMQDQAFVRSQMIKYLRTLTPGERMAVFSLGSRLRILQGFTDNPSNLLSALNDKESVGTHASSLLVTGSEKNANRELLAHLAMSMASAETIDAVRRFQEDNADARNNERVEITLQALQDLARYLSEIPGRKNVIWFSSSFPISVFPNAEEPGRINNAQLYATDVANTAKLLTANQVAVYPISATGLTTDGLYSAAFRRGPSITQGNRERAANQIAMESLAKDTGGEAFYNTNGLAQAVTRVVNEGTHYYTLTYTPTNTKTDGKFRKIHLQLRHESYKLAYRRGYYGENAKKGRAKARLPESDPLLPLVGFGMPNLSQILYEVRVSPSSSQPAPGAPLAGGNREMKGPRKRYVVEFAVLEKDLKLKQARNGVRHGQIEELVIAYDREGKPLNMVLKRSQLVLNPKAYQDFQHIGVQLRDEIDVPANVPDGSIYLHTGVYDLDSTNAGTLAVLLNNSAMQPVSK